jgi:zinc protease
MKRYDCLLLIIVCLLAFVCSNSGADQLPQVKFEKYELPNGLDVILHEDHSIPMVSVNVWYHVGSRNEKRGRTGFAHLFEHMMFQGSEHHDDEYTFEQIGGADNATTSEDRTSYYENIPSNYLELALWMEADRMGFLLPAMTQKKLDNQRDVVKNERRQRLENEPYNKVFDLLPPLLFPADHPYSWTVIGSMADLTAASIEDISEFFRSYYTPNNASLSVAGDFNSAEAKKWIEKYFASIPPGPPVDRLTSWVPKLESIRRAETQDNVNLPRVYYVWHSPAHYKPGDAELDLLANILASGKTSRLYKALVYDQQIAQDVQAFQSSNELSSTFLVIVTAREGQSLDELEKAIDAELRKVLSGGITPKELKQAQSVYEAGFVRNLEEVGGFGGVADSLNNYNVSLGDPGKFQWDLDRYTKATTADVLRFAKDSLDLDHRLILRVLPQGDLNSEKASPDRKAEPKAGPEPKFTPPKIQRDRLSNGADILLVEDHSLPLVQTNLVLRSGWAADPENRPGAASLTAELLDEGTKTRSALQISEAVKNLGAIFRTSSSFDGSQVRVNVLKRNLDQALALMSDVVLNPTFPEQELERQRKIYLGTIQQESKEPVTSAFKLYLHTLFGPGHPYGEPYTGSGTESSIKAIQREDLLKYYQTNYSPSNAAFVVVGDINMEEAKTKLQRVFGNWKSVEVANRDVPPAAAPNQIKIYLVDKPGAPQSVIVMGNPGIRRNDPEYEAVDVMNNVLGGQFTSRINMNLREDKGYAYGASSFFLTTRAPGAFVMYAAVQAQSTKESVAEMLKELRDITSSRPLTQEEVTKSKDNLIKSYPQQFQTFSGIAAQLAEIVLYQLPEDEWTRYVQEVNKVDTSAATQVAKKHLHPDKLLIVVVGDRAKIEPGLRELKLGEIGYLQPTL